MGFSKQPFNQDTNSEKTRFIEIWQRKIYSLPPKKKIPKNDIISENGE